MKTTGRRRFWDPDKLGEESRRFVARLMSKLEDHPERRLEWAEVERMAKGCGLEPQWFRSLMRHLDNDLGCVARVARAGRDPNRWDGVQITTLGQAWWVDDPWQIGDKL